MAKDPAFLFYPNDFTSGTQFFSNEQVGKYLRLLLAQHQHGHLTGKQMQIVCGGIADAEILEKFLIDSDGKYYNKRLDDEIVKRKKHSEKQKENANMRWHKNGIDLAMPLENRNRNKDVIINKKEKEEKNEIRENVFLTTKEIEKLKLDFCEGYEWAIDTISNYKFSSGKKYKSDYHALIGWVKDKYTQEKNKTNGKYTSERNQRVNEVANLSASLENFFGIGKNPNTGTNSPDK